jgi:hypothetical protein
MPALSKIAVAAVALIGGASAGTITITNYEGAGCTTRTTECGAHDVKLPDQETCGDTCDCPAEDVTEVPPATSEWTSGECVLCTGDDCTWPYFAQNGTTLDILRAYGVDPSYAKVTCANGVTTVQHFSDAECTAANKVSNEAIAAALSAELTTMLDSLGMDEVGPCITSTINMMSGVDISGSYCDTLMSSSLDEVRVLSLPHMHVRGIV